MGWGICFHRGKERKIERKKTIVIGTFLVEHSFTCRKPKDRSSYPSDPFRAIGTPLSPAIIKRLCFFGNHFGFNYFDLRIVRFA